MIVPAGQAKKQINQGQLKYQPDSYLFGGLNGELLKNAVAVTPPVGQGNEELNQAMNQSSNPGISGQMPNQPSQPPASMPSGKSIAPSGNASNGTASSPFLQPINTQNTVDVQLMEEKQKIRQSAGPDFVVNLKKTNQGFELMIAPREGLTLSDPDGFANSLMQAVDGVADEVSDPDRNTGVMKIVYKSRINAQNRIEKPGTKRK